VSPGRACAACERGCSPGCDRRARLEPYSAIVSDLRRARFARLVRNALNELPAEFHERIRNLEIVIEDEPAPEQVAGGGTLLGLYEGVPLTARGAQEPYLPDRICIFRRPIERMSAS